MLIIPIGHDQAVRRQPWVTLGLIAICTLVQIHATFLASPDPAASAIYRHGYYTGSGLGLSLITSAFVHDGWIHLVGNMLFLWLAGSAIEDRWGWWFPAFYLAAAAAATLCFDALYRGAPTVLVGASGAISAAMGAFLVCCYRTEITFWYWLMYRSGTFRLPAYLALPLWFADQLLSARLGRGEGVDEEDAVSSIAYQAHLGGFVFGCLVAIAVGMLWSRRDAASGGASPAEADAPTPSRRTQLEDRYQQCLGAIDRRDVGKVSTLASRTILDLARAQDHARILTLMKAATARLARVELTDGAFTAALLAADALGDAASYLSIAAMFVAERPRAIGIPKVMWRLAEGYRDAGQVDQAVVTLEALALRFPSDPFGVQARDALASRHR
ncbi:MAG: rhomboid family intramembrane serine protease [Proteobacteria bacterium]|nr:rhomboid family intramembrane serine protease [Pseudomonadota bacterium]